LAEVSLGTSSIAFVLNCHLWPNNSVRVTSRTFSAYTNSSDQIPLLQRLPQAAGICPSDL
jgi:hypothetical protein